MTLIEAFKLVAAAESSPRLNIVGAGPHQGEYEALAAKTGYGDRIAFFGYQADPRRFLLGSDIFVLASHADPAPLVLAEARDCGCAIVATEVGGIPEMLDRGKAGILVPVEAARPDRRRAAEDPARSRPARRPARAGRGTTWPTSPCSAPATNAWRFTARRWRPERKRA